MLRILLTPLRWLVRLVVFLLIIALLLIWLIPTAFDIPARAAAVLHRLSAGETPWRVQAVPAAVHGFPPYLVLNDLQIVPAGGSRPALIAEETVVRVDMAESIARREVVLRAEIMQPKIMADQPFSLAALNSAITATLGITTIVGIIGGQIISAGGKSVIDLGTTVGTIVVPPIIGGLVPGLPGIPGLPALPGGTGGQPGAGSAPVATVPGGAAPGQPLPGQPVSPLPPGGMGPGGGVPGIPAPGVPAPGIPNPGTPVPPGGAGPGLPPGGGTGPGGGTPSPTPIGQTPIPVPGQPGMCYCACPCPLP